MNGIINLPLADVDDVKPCPFCGSTEIRLCNTWTASYWLECAECGAQAGDYEVVDRDPHSMAAHKRSKRAALAAWNRRFSQ